LLGVVPAAVGIGIVTGIVGALLFIGLVNGGVCLTCGAAT